MLAKGALLKRHLAEWLRPAALKRRFLQFLSLGDPPERIAWGVAVGVFLGIFPTFSLGIPLAVLGSRFFRYNPAAAVAGSVISNPFTTPLVIAISAALGSLITGREWQAVAGQIQEGQWLAAAWATVITYMAGNLILCAVSAIPAYFLTKQAVVVYRRRRGIGV